MTTKLAIFIALGGFTGFYVTALLASLRRARRGSESGPGEPVALSLAGVLTGFVTDFFDTLGIGAFATTTSIFKFRRMVPDRLIPGTLNAGHTLPVIFQAFVYISVIEVDMVTLVLLIVASVIGAWFGAGLVAGLSRRAVQLGMGLALLAAAAAMFMSQLELFPLGGSTLELEGWRLAAGIAGNFLFGALMTLGVGFYAPCMTMVSLLGMNPVAAFPIMMGSCAFLMPVASVRFIRRRAYLPAATVGLAVGGLLGVPLAAFVVRALPLGAIRWLVIVVVVYAAVLMLRSAAESGRDDRSDA